MVSRDGWLLLDMVLAVPLMVAVSRLSEQHRPGPWVRHGTPLVGVLLMLISGWQTFTALRAQPTIITQRFSNFAMMVHTGPLVFHAVDAWLMIKRNVARELLPEASFVETKAWFDQRRALRAGGGQFRYCDGDEPGGHPGRVAAGIDGRFAHQRAGGHAQPGAIASRRHLVRAGL